MKERIKAREKRLKIGNFCKCIELISELSMQSIYILRFTQESSTINSN